MPKQDGLVKEELTQCTIGGVVLFIPVDPTNCTIKIEAFKRTWGEEDRGRRGQGEKRTGGEEDRRRRGQEEKRTGGEEDRGRRGQGEKRTGGEEDRRRRGQGEKRTGGEEDAQKKRTNERSQERGTYPDNKNHRT